MKDLGKTISEKRKSAGLSQGQLAERMKDFGFAPSNASVSSWEKNVSIPNASQFLSICQILGIRDIYSEFISDSELDLTKLNETGKQKAMEYIKLLMLSPENIIEKIDTEDKKKKTVVLSIPSTEEKPSRIVRLYDLPVSAGTGEFLDGESYTEVVADDLVPLQTDFGLRIKGDSMEPRYKNGQTVWIKQTAEIRNGEIGIFLLDGNAYCKMLKKNDKGVQLISLNDEYAPITVTEESSFAVFGKVLN